MRSRYVGRLQGNQAWMSFLRGSHSEIVSWFQGLPSVGSKLLRETFDADRWKSASFSITFWTSSVKHLPRLCGCRRAGPIPGLSLPQPKPPA